MDADSSIQALKGVGAKTEQLFQRVGVYTVGDILLHYPRGYEQLPPEQTVGELFAVGDAAGNSVIRGGTTSSKAIANGVAGENAARDGAIGETGLRAAILAKVERVPLVKRSGRMQVTTLQLLGGGHALSAVWFHMPYLKNSLKQGETYVFLGKLRQNGKGVSLEQPQVLSPEKYREMRESLMPCYALTEGLSRNMVAKAVRQALEQLDLSNDYLPEEIRQRCHLTGHRDALWQIHFPKDQGELQVARRRLVFDEFFQFILAARLQKQQMELIQNEFSFVPMEGSLADDVASRLPYELTGVQKRTLWEIRENLRAPVVMQRLVQGDVGSGKTIVAFLSMLDCAQSGYQSALMAPTEVLARQHYETFLALCGKYGLEIPVVLLTGSMPQREKRDAYDRLKVCPNAMVVGTHALIQERAVFGDLALVVTDEQHRFGVRQRERLYQKGHCPHTLVMSATPIPRTLAIILYGDLDISVMDEVPARRLPIKNCVIGKNLRPQSYDLIRKEASHGHQAYVICPLIEESEGIEAENVLDYAKKLGQALPGLSIACLHGKMKDSQKNQVMEAFAKNEVQVLVSTTVIEVGIDVPNATVMMIEDAQRFGLSQLHQLRGRVGRGEAQSYCILVQTAQGEDAKERLEALSSSNDGFFIASEDLRLRGPGDFFGIRQSGLAEFKLGDVYQDSDVLKEAQEEALRLLSEDPRLANPENEGIRKRVLRFLEGGDGTANL